MAKQRGKHKRRGGATHRRRRASTAVARINPPRKRARHNPHHRARHRRNPPGARTIMRELPGTVVRTVVRAAETTAGVILARKVRAMTKQQPGTLVGSAVELLTGVAAGIGLSFVNEPLAEAVMTGCFMAPIMSGVVQLGVPHISDSLGDDGTLVGPGTGLTLVQAYPDIDENTRVTGETLAGEELGQFVTGDRSTGAIESQTTLGDSWVTGDAA